MTKLTRQRSDCSRCLSRLELQKRVNLLSAFAQPRQTLRQRRPAIYKHRVQKRTQNLCATRKGAAITSRTHQKRKREWDNAQPPLRKRIHLGDGSVIALQIDRDNRSPCSKDKALILPLELTHEIIGLLWDDPVSLFACALTCHSWSACSVNHIAALQKLNIQNRAQFDNLVLPALYGEHTRRQYFSHVRNLIISEDGQRPYAHIIPHVLGISMSALERMTIRDADFASAKAPLHFSFFLSLSQFTTMTNLNLSVCKFQTIGELQRLICSLPSLSWLSLRSVEWTNPSQSSRHGFGLLSTAKLQLTSLTLWSMGAEEINGICDWFTAMENPLALQSLALGRPHHTGWQFSFASLLRAAGPSLRHLRIPLVSKDDDHRGWAPKLSLTSLVVSPSNDVSWSTAQANVEFMSSWIASGKSSSLAFDLVSQEWVNAESIDTNAFDKFMEFHDPDSKEVVSRELPFDVVCRVLPDVTAGFFSDLERRLSDMQWDARGLVRTSSCTRQTSLSLVFSPSMLPSN
ncbi:hypothetical protein AcV7_003112 [Taiwanofungus camphoratus]|nr:hypothetical protein AcV7_003112 [Antrodia cinnamomea]